jgi:hypothetical protein
MRKTEEVSKEGAELGWEGDLMWFCMNCRSMTEIDY